MKKIYYLDRTFAFGTSAEIEGVDCQLTESIDQTKLELFSDSAKTVGIICDYPELEFAKFCANFELIEAAGGVVKSPSGETLMIFRNGRWDLPKGKREEEEELCQCALREVEEECAVSGLTLEEFRAHTYHIYKIKGDYVLKQTWWWNMSHSGDGVLVPQADEGITQARWVAQSEMAECMKNSYLTIRELLEQ